MKCEKCSGEVVHDASYHVTNEVDVDEYKCSKCNWKFNHFRFNAETKAKQQYFCNEKESEK